VRKQWVGGRYLTYLENALPAERQERVRGRGAWGIPVCGATRWNARQFFETIQKRHEGESAFGLSRKGERRATFTAAGGRGWRKSLGKVVFDCDGCGNRAPEVK